MSPTTMAIIIALVMILKIVRKEEPWRLEAFNLNVLYKIMRGLNTGNS